MSDLMMALKMAKSIDTLGLSTSTYNALRRWGYGINTIADMYVYHIEHSISDGYGNKGINRIRGIGGKARTEIDDLLIANGLPTLEQLKEQNNLPTSAK